MPVTDADQDAAAANDVVDSYSAGTADPIVVPRWIGAFLMITGGIGAAASFILAAEKYHVLSDPNYVPGCTLNATFSCTSVMMSWQAGVFGFPNPLLGVLTFPMVVTLGTLIFAGFQPPRWAWWALQVGTLSGVVFVHWLFVQSVFSIEALCLYCMIVWTVTIPTFWYVTLVNVSNDPGRLSRRLPRWHFIPPAIWLAIIFSIVTLRFA